MAHRANGQVLAIVRSFLFHDTNLLQAFVTYVRPSQNTFGFLLSVTVGDIETIERVLEMFIKRLKGFQRYHGQRISAALL